MLPELRQHSHRLWVHMKPGVHDLCDKMLASFEQEAFCDADILELLSVLLAPFCLQRRGSFGDAFVYLWVGRLRIRIDRRRTGFNFRRGWLNAYAAAQVHLRIAILLSVG